VLKNRLLVAPPQLHVGSRRRIKLLSNARIDLFCGINVGVSMFGVALSAIITLEHDEWFDEMRQLLFRLWLVATVLWACLILFFADDTRLNANVIAAQLAFAPPAIIFAIGVMLARAFGHQK
jgi:hypothetical protein